MKKTMVSLAAASLIATTAMAADKGIDIVTTGQAVIYYETQNDDGKTAGKDDSSLFNQDSSAANVGLQLNLDADLKNNFTFGSQLSYLGTAGLEKNLVSDTKQVPNGLGTTNSAGIGLNGQNDTTSNIALTQIFVAKKIGNTTVKIGRQELPKSLSPFAYSEGWNVFKNTFDAVLAVNTDIPDTTLVGAYVSGGTGMDLSTTDDLVVAGNAGNVSVEGTAYMLTVQNKSIPMTTVTLSYYDMAKIGQAASVTNASLSADAIWADVAVAGKDLPLGLKFGLQGGQISPDSTLNNVGAVGTNLSFDDTTAFGAKVGMAPVDALTLCVAYTTVDGDDNKQNVAIKNTGTGIESPLYTQMVYNQNAISLDADTFMLKAAYNTGDYGTVTAQYAHTSAGKSNLMGADKDYQEFDLIYSVKAAGVQYFAAYIYRDIDKGGTMGATAGTTDVETDHRIRAWARYNF